MLFKEEHFCLLKETKKILNFNLVLARITYLELCNKKV